MSSSSSPRGGRPTTKVTGISYRSIGVYVPGDLAALVLDVEDASRYTTKSDRVVAVLEVGLARAPRGHHNVTALYGGTPRSIRADLPDPPGRNSLKKRVLRPTEKSGGPSITARIVTLLHYGLRLDEQPLVVPKTPLTLFDLQRTGTG